MKEVNSGSSNPLIFTVWTLYLLVFSFACYEPKEDCLDVLATNFDVQADEPCPDCCQYPSLKLSIAHKAGEEFLSFDSLYTTDSIHYFLIKDLRFYLSNLQLVPRTGESLGVTNLVEMSVKTPSGNEIIEVEDNFQLVTRQSGNYTIGEILASGSFDQIQFFVGVPIEVNNADPLSLPDNHPLGPQTDTMHWNQDAGYIFNKITLQPDTSSNELKIIEIGSIPNLVSVQLPFLQDIKVGFDVSLSVEIDYLKWFKGIDFAASDAEIRQKIVENTAEAFSLAP